MSLTCSHYPRNRHPQPWPAVASWLVSFYSCHPPLPSENSMTITHSLTEILNHKPNRIASCQSALEVFSHPWNKIQIIGRWLIKPRAPGIFVPPYTYILATSSLAFSSSETFAFIMPSAGLLTVRLILLHSSPLLSLLHCDGFLILKADPCHLLHPSPVSFSLEPWVLDITAWLLVTYSSSLVLVCPFLFSW